MEIPMDRKSVPMRELVAAVAGPILPSDNRESWLRRAARNAGASYRQAKALFYGEIDDPHHRTVSLFRQAAGRHEASNLAAQFESIARGLDAADPDFHRDTILALRGVVGLLSNVNRAGTEGVRGKCKPLKETGQ
jgi:hypothetical protein